MHQQPSLYTHCTILTNLHFQLIVRFEVYPKHPKLKKTCHLVNSFISKVPIIKFKKNPKFHLVTSWKNKCTYQCKFPSECGQRGGFHNKNDPIPLVFDYELQPGGWVWTGLLRYIWTKYFPHHQELDWNFYFSLKSHPWPRLPSFTPTLWFTLIDPKWFVAKNQHPIVIWGWDMSTFMLWWPYTNPSNFASVPNVMNWGKIRRVYMESSEHESAHISPPKWNRRLIFGKRAFFMMLFLNVSSYPIISQF